jgi:hypothetical protein
MGDTAMCINPKDPKNQWLRGHRVIVPLVGREVPVIEDRYVDIEFGTGCLKVTPAHDVNDYNLGKTHNLDSIDIVLTGLKQLGFDDVFEVSRAAELVSEATRALIKENKLKKPIISSACPAIVRLIKIRFPELCDNVMPLLAPIEVAARIARKEAMEDTGLKSEEIGVFFITPCAAKVTEVHSPNSIKESACDGAIAISQIYPDLTQAMDHLTEVEPLSQSGIIGIGWANSGGEAAAMLGDKYLAADGIENVIRVLEELEDEHIRDVDFVELNACSGGCVGGVLTVENAYVAQARIQNLRKYLPVSMNHIKDGDMDRMKWEKALEFDADIFRLDKDINKAFEMMSSMEDIYNELPHLDCGSCGAPTCRAMAEDIVKGRAKETDCIFKLKEKIQSVYDQLRNTI